MTQPASTTTYVVRLEQLNRIDPDTKDFAPLGRGDEIQLDPKSADAKRLLDAKAIVEKADDAAPAAVVIDPASSAHPEDLPEGSHAAPADEAQAAPLAPSSPLAGSQPSAVQTEGDQAGQGSPVS